VVGFDNSRVAALPPIRLTSVDQSGTDLGTQAAEVLLERIKGRSDPHYTLLEAAPDSLRQRGWPVAEDERAFDSLDGCGR
jgi:DNA-binding LacI/PurR family transcriptional regulator